jgi:hypothetical protein
VWLLTAVIEVSLLCTGTLSVLLWFLWRRLRRLDLKVKALQQVQTTSSVVTAGPTERSGGIGTSAVLETDGDDGGATTVAIALEEQLDTTAALIEAELDMEALVETEETEEGPRQAEVPTATLTQEMLDNLFSGALKDEDEDAALASDLDAAGIPQDMAAILTENAAMEKQIGALQEKGVKLRHAIEALRANTTLPLEEQQDLPVPETMMQEMEQGLEVLRQGCERMQHTLQTHCQSLGLGAHGENMPTPPETTMQEEIVQLKSVLEQRTSEFEHVQEEYDTLLTEYQRIFERNSE